MGLRVFDTKTRISGEMKDGKPKIELYIRAEAYVDGTHGNDQFDKAKTYTECNHCA